MIRRLHQRLCRLFQFALSPTTALIAKTLSISLKHLEEGFHTEAMEIFQQIWAVEIISFAAHPQDGITQTRLSTFVRLPSIMDGLNAHLLILIMQSASSLNRKIQISRFGCSLCMKKTETLAILRNTQKGGCQYHLVSIFLF